MVSIARLILACLLGWLTGFLSGAFGIGGAIVSTPSIRLIMMEPPGIALGTTLPLAFPSALVGSFNYWRKGKINVRAFKVSAFWGFFSSVAGAYSTKFIDPHWLMVTTAFLILYLALRTFRQGFGRKGWKGEGGKRDGAEPARFSSWKYALIGFSAGLMAGLLGLGGGVVLVPGFLLWARLEVKEALGTSLAVIAVIALPGTVIHSLLGHIDWMIFLAMVVGVMPGSYAGSRFTLKVQEKRVLMLFSLLLFATGIIFVFEELMTIFRL